MGSFFAFWHCMIALRHLASPVLHNIEEPMIKSLMTTAAVAGVFGLAGCAMDMSMPSTEIARATVNGETFVLYDTHHGIFPGQDIYDVRWANNNRHFHSFTAGSDDAAIRRLERQIAEGLDRWENCRGAGQNCRD